MTIKKEKKLLKVGRGYRLGIPLEMVRIIFRDEKNLIIEVENGEITLKLAGGNNE